MGLRLFPEPTAELITPYLRGDDGAYRCLDENGATVRVGLCDDEIVTAGQGPQRLPNRERVLEWAARPKAPAAFMEFVAATHVVPTFSRSGTEALVRVVMRQIVTRTQARSTIARFIRQHGVTDGGLFGFPCDATIRSLGADDFTELGLGFRSARLVEAIAESGSDQMLLRGRLPGVGPWSRAVLESDLRKDFSYYPMSDKSGECAGEALGVELEDLRRRDPELAADLYVYALAWIEVGRASHAEG